MDSAFRFADELGPVKIIHVYEPSINLKGVLVVDNVAKGPSIGGLRMAEDVSTEECFRLARAMTLKNAAAGLPHGGGKSVLVGDPKMPLAQKETLIRAFAQALRNEESYIFGPDMGTDELCMAWVRDEIGRSVGLPREVGGIPLDEIGATGWGLFHAVEVALPFCDFAIDEARVVIQGFGSVGQHAAKFLADKGARLVACSDSQGAIFNPDGLHIEELIALKNQGKSVIDGEQGEKMERDAVIDVECDIWIPAARPDVIDEHNMHRLNTKLIPQGANIPMTAAAEAKLYQQGIIYIPDFIANAGGVICAAMEYRGTTQSEAFTVIAEKIRRNTEIVLSRAKQEQLLPREAASQLAEERVKKAMQTRRFSAFSTAPNSI